MAEPRYQPAPRSRPSPYGSRPQRSRRAPKQAVPWEQDPVVEAPVAAPVQSQPSPQPDAPKPWESDPVVEPPKDPTFYEQYVAPVGKAISDTGTAVKDWAVGKHDPRFKGLPSIDEPEVAVDAGLQLGPLNSAKVAGFSDEAYRDIIRKQLGDRYLGETVDENGFIVLHYRGHDGKQASAYVNKPGIDYADIDRGVNSALPFLAAGGVVGRAGVYVGAPLAARAAGQAGAGAIASAVQDRAAVGMGSEQNPETWGIDPIKAGLAAAGGAAGEYIGAFIGSIIQKNQVNKQLVDTATGKLTQNGRRLAESQGLDPDLVDGELAKQFARLAAQTDDPTEALLKVQTDQFNIPTTVGQRTKDPQYLLTEKDIRAGTLGREAKESMRHFDETQKRNLDIAVRGPPGRKSDWPTNPVNGFTAMQNTGVAPVLAPHRVFMDQNADTLGREGIKKGFARAVNTAQEAENFAWRQAGNATARAGASRTLPANVKEALKGRRIDRSLQPVSSKMIDELRAYMAGKAPDGEFSEFVGQQAVTTLDEMRRVMLGYFRDASPANGDKSAARRIYQGFNDWLAEIEAKGLISGDAAGVSKMRQAMDVTKYVKGLLKPTDSSGNKTRVAKIFDKIKDADTGEEVITALLGASGPKGSFPADGVKALRNYKQVVHQFGGDIGKQAWNDVRLAYWLKLVTNKEGETLSPQLMKTSIRTAMHNQKSAWNTLFSTDETKQIRQLVEALKVVTAKDPNPSGSGTAVRGLLPEMVASQADILAAREKFKLSTGSGNPILNRLMVQIWRGLSKHIRSPVRTDQFAVNRVTSQSVRKKAPPSLGGYASPGLANALAEEH
jgi:hypothetical protein